MTRSSLHRTLRRSYWLLALVLLISLGTKLAEHIPGIAGGPLEKLAQDIYEYLKDMALVFVTVVAAYLASVFQRRHGFVEALREEWRDIIKAKSALIDFTHIDAPAQDQYFKAFCTISDAIDNMRSVYKNVGETNKKIGLYPYESLHDMRRAFQHLRPRDGKTITAEDRSLVRDAILQSWRSIRESFLDELDLEPPTTPILISGGKRTKQDGAEGWVAGYVRKQQRQQNAIPGRADVNAFLSELREKERVSA